MSLRRRYFVTCDKGVAEHCHVRISLGGGSPSSKAARSYARRSGWKRVKESDHRRDYADVCPPCHEKAR